MEMNQNRGKIEGLQLTNFTCFSDLEISFSEGINLFIGENGLGKTHLLKILFISSYGGEEYTSFSGENELLSTFIGEEKMITELNANGELIINRNFSLIFGIHDKHELKKIKNQEFKIKPIRSSTARFESVFLPVNEMLSWYKGFIPAYENRESSIDYVYYLLAKKLASLPLKGDKLKEQKALLSELETALGFEVVRKGEEFFIAFAQDQVHNAKLVANGINKIAQVIYLIMNGSLTKNSILFWDEPEAGLNPKYIVLVAKFLQTLAKAGCQIFVATHDYLLSHTLSLAAEYRDLDPETPPMRFFSLYKSEEGTKIESADTLPEIVHNSILDEYAEYYQFQEELFYKSIKVQG